MQTTEIKCDACSYDLQYTGNCEDWSLVLGSQAKKPWYMREGLRGGAVTSMALRPPVDRTYHFCGLGCLAKWMIDQHPDAVKEYERLAKNRARLAEE